jgi:hypothetical protein
MAAMDARSLNLRATVPDAVITRELDGETILLNLDTGIYFGLDKVGTDVWGAIRATATLQDALDRLQSEYDVGPAVLRSDFMRLVDELLAKGLLQRADSPPPGA